ncbi:MAG: ferredoxin-type protein NapF [Motiliproteus sp.]|nr:ferredoxin-type protein NapF [Motiliproteus sp.]MCW9051571.1 ferredoxin-type protein NapF [Motiliproteus sp.]
MSSAFNPSRRQLFRGDVGVRRLPLRPPWSVEEDLFTQDCSRCHECIKACPENILEAGSGGFPEVNFQQGECSFCTDCAAVCEAPVFRSVQERPWSQLATISESCITHKQVVCRSCGENCEPEAIQFKLTAGQVAVPTIDIDLCTGCGACLAVCPVQAVSISVSTEESKS